MFIRLTLAFILFVLLAPSGAMAADGCCDHCGCTTGCKVVCVLKCETEEVEVTCWACKWEDFCVPGPSHEKCRRCEMVCADGTCTCEGPKPVPKKFVWFEWAPGCAEVRSRKRLMRRTIIKEIPSYTWVVSTCCPQCTGNLQGAEIQPDAEVPPPPPMAVELRYRNPRNLPVDFERDSAHANPPSAAPDEERSRRTYANIFASFVE